MFPLRDNTPRRSTPIMTLLLMAANVGVFLFEISLPREQLESLVRVFGLVPAENAHTVFPFLTSMFLHGGLLHIFSNLWVLWIFGDNVEDRMGSGRFLVFYLLCGFAASGAHMVASPHSEMPVVGASGAIAGVLGAYFVMYPRARLVCVFPIFFYPLFFQIPAFFFILLWFLTQVLSGTVSNVSPEQPDVAWWAHVGGFAAGVVLHRLFIGPAQTRRRMYEDEYGLAGPWRR
jgi:membrane associated rhomboid family serine protease